jgi:hypothetical protein
LSGEKFVHFGLERVGLWEVFLHIFIIPHLEGFGSPIVPLHQLAYRERQPVFLESSRGPHQ